jgi:hypothetical protein
LGDFDLKSSKNRNNSGRTLLVAAGQHSVIVIDLFYQDVSEALFIMDSTTAYLSFLEVQWLYG